MKYLFPNFEYHCRSHLPHRHRCAIFMVHAVEVPHSTNDDRQFGGALYGKEELLHIVKSSDDFAYAYGLVTHFTVVFNLHCCCSSPTSVSFCF